MMGKIESNHHGEQFSSLLKERYQKRICDQLRIQKSPSNILGYFINVINAYSDHFEIEKIVEELRSIKIDDNHSFAKNIISALEPYFDFARSDPIKTEFIIRKYSVDSNEYTALDERYIFSYHNNNNNIWLHIGTSKTISPSILMKYLGNAINRITILFKNEKLLNNLKAASPLLSNERIRTIFIKRYGFSIDGYLSRERQKEVFPTIEELVPIMSISRDKLLDATNK